MKIKQHIKKWNLIFGLIIIIINLYVVWDNLDLMYRYRNPNILWLFMYSDWVLILNAILGLIGICLGILLILDLIKIKFTILLDTIILVAGALIKMLSLILR